MTEEPASAYAAETASDPAEFAERTGTEASHSSRRQPKRLLTFLCAALLVWAAWCVGYSVWRQPANVFEEIYWADVDANAWRVVGLPGIVPFDMDPYVPSFLNAFKITTLDDSEIERYEEHEPVQAPLSLKDDGIDPMEYCTNLKLDIGGTLRVGESRYNLEGKFMLYSRSDLNGGLILFSPDAHPPASRPKERAVSFWCEYDPSTKQISAHIEHPGRITDEEARMVCNELLFNVFLKTYFEDAGGKSRFSPDDLGDWSWGKIDCT